MSNPDSSEIESALAAMEADELRALFLATLEGMRWEDELRPRSRLANSIIKHAVRSASGRGGGWAPASPSDDDFIEVLLFVDIAKRMGYADSSDVDDHLQKGSNAFLAKDYAAAARIFRALFRPLSAVEIDLGQSEMVDEVLCVDVANCVAQYVVAKYMTAAPDQRAHAVRAAIGEMSEIAGSWSPLRRMEQATVEPLPGFDAFLPQWRNLIEEEIAAAQRRDGEGLREGWFREVVKRMHGVEGLAEIARSSRHADDFSEWCRTLAASKDWDAALSAYEEAARDVSHGASLSYCRVDFLEGATLAAKELGREDLSDRLERTWRFAPTVWRLCRWIGSSSSRRVVRKRAAQALKVCPKKAIGQQAFLFAILGQYAAPANVLGAASGLGWSQEWHPGHLLLPVLCTLLGGDCSGLMHYAARYTDGSLDPSAFPDAAVDAPRIAVPTTVAITQLAALDQLVDAESRATILLALRKAAEKRIQGAIECQRRSVYGHAAHFVAACAALDETPAGRQWVTKIRAESQQCPELQRELDHLMS